MRAIRQRAAGGKSLRSLRRGLAGRHRAAQVSLTLHGTAAERQADEMQPRASALIASARILIMLIASALILSLSADER